MITLHNQHGNVLFIILIAVALFAALSYAVTQDRTSVKDKSGEQEKLDQAVTENCQAQVDYAKMKLRTLQGCADDEMNYVLPSGINDNPDARADGACNVFFPGEGGATPCGAYLDIDCELNLTTLDLGESCGGIVYAGDISGSRLYTTSENLGRYQISDTLTSMPAASSQDNGAINTDKLIAANGSPYQYPAALACRALGDEWYIPARNELNVLRINQNVGDLAETFPSNQSSGRYWSSTRHGTSHNRFLICKITNSSCPVSHYVNVTDTNYVRCVRRD